jgi:hypothetical protein
MRIENCAECDKDIRHGEIMFSVYWSVATMHGTKVNFICQQCMQGFLREPVVPGGRV